jgi:hypothetical protein
MPDTKYAGPWRQAAGVRQDANTPVTVDGDPHPLLVDSVGRLKVTAPIATGSSYTRVTTASTNAASIKASPGNLFSLSLSNPTATATFVKLYDKASAPTVGTDVPVVTVPVAASSCVALTLGSIGKLFATGIAIAVTAAAVATDTANAVAGVQIHGTYI